MAYKKKYKIYKAKNSYQFFRKKSIGESPPCTMKALQSGLHNSIAQQVIVVIFFNQAAEQSAAEGGNKAVK